MRITALALIVALFTLTGHAFASQNVDWHSVGSAIPLGSKVKIQTLDGKRVGGTLVRVDSTSVQVKRNARRPEAATVIAFDRISDLQ